MNLNLICPGTWRLIASSAVFQLPSFFSAILLPCCIMAVVRITLSCLAETSALRQSGTCVVLEGHCLLWAKLINKLIIAAWLASSSALLRSGESSDRAVVCAERARAECQEGVPRKVSGHSDWNANPEKSDPPFLVLWKDWNEEWEFRNGLICTQLGSYLAGSACCRSIKSSNWPVPPGLLRIPRLQWGFTIGENWILGRWVSVLVWS